MVDGIAERRFFVIQQLQDLGDLIRSLCTRNSTVGHDPECIALGDDKSRAVFYLQTRGEPRRQALCR